MTLLTKSCPRPGSNDKEEMKEPTPSEIYYDTYDIHELPPIG